MLTFTLKISEETEDILEKLAKAMGKSTDEVLSISIAAMKVLLEAKELGQKVGIDTNEDGLIEDEIIIPLKKK